jgi:predicted ATPase/class 3 adenylate cyclase
MATHDSTAASLPTGTVTFLFTDIEGSTRLLQALGDRYPELLEEHRRLLREAIAEYGGVEFGSEGDALFVVFPSAPSAVAGAAAAQRALAGHPWPGDAPIEVRMGLHTGEGVVSGGSYVGLDVHRAARISSAAHGGQIVISAATKTLAEGGLPTGLFLRDLGDHRLKDLANPEHLFQVDVQGLRVDFPALRSMDARPNNLQAQLTSFIGREREEEEVRGLLAQARLLTLTGPGGTGKTRLSLEVAADLLPEFADGVFFVALATVPDAALVPSAIAHALGIQEAGERPVLDLLKQHLEPKEMLLILDNFEQIVDAAPIVSDLLTSAPRITVLVTSREVLHLSGEQEYPVPPLALPDPEHLPSLEALSQYDAVALFIQRARSVNPGFEVTNQNAPAVAEICSMLDGLPLAIELAAARSKLLSPEAMLKRLENRLAVLTTSARDLPARQQTLRGAIDWSYDLLEESERAVFRRLAVFMRGSTVEATEVVVGTQELNLDVLDAVGSLVDKSLLRQFEFDGEPRFQMLMTIREYALERLAASDEHGAVARRHAEFFRNLVRDAEPSFTKDPEVLERVEREHDNIRVALRFLSESGDIQTALSMAGELWRFWHLHGHLTEGRMSLTELLGGPRAEERTQARGRALSGLAGLEYWQSDYGTARGHWEEARSIFHELGNVEGEGWAVYSLAYLAAIEEDDEAALELAEESVRLFEAAGNRGNAVEAKSFLTYLAWANDDWEAAQRLSDEVLTDFRELGDTFGVANALHSAARVLRQLGRYSEARQKWAEAIELFQQLKDVSGQAMALGGLATVPAFEGDPERAVKLGGAARAAEENLGGQAPTRLRGFEDARDLVRGKLDEQRIAELWEEGRQMDLDTAIKEALREPDPN